MVLRSQRFRAAAIVVAVLTVTGPLSVALLFRIFGRHRDALLRFGPFRSYLKRYNLLSQRISGTRLSSHGLLIHRGRRSGRSYRTPLAVVDYRDGVLLPLTYGPTADWYRNVRAAQGGTLTWKGRTYQLERPEIVSGPEPLQAWPFGSRIILQISGIDDFVWLHRRDEISPDRQS